MKIYWNTKSIQSFWMTWIIFAILLSACSSLADGVRTVEQAPPPIVQGQAVALFQRTTEYLIDQGMKDAFGVVKYLKEDTGDLVVARTPWKGITEFVSINLKTLRVNSGVTGNLVNTNDWEGIEQLLKDLGFKAVSAAEIAAAYTGKAWSALKTFATTAQPTILIVPVGVLDDPFWWDEYQNNSKQ